MLFGALLYEHCRACDTHSPHLFPALVPHDAARQWKIPVAFRQIDGCIFNARSPFNIDIVIVVVSLALDVRVLYGRCLVHKCLFACIKEYMLRFSWSIHPTYVSSVRFPPSVRSSTHREEFVAEDDEEEEEKEKVCHGTLGLMNPIF